MKKFLSKITVILLAVLLVLGATGCGCGGSMWNKDDVTLKDWGKVVATSNGGFIGETENYLYVINGIGDSTQSNDFGKPVKGSLMAVDKKDITKNCIVVPKLFVATDYTSGIFLKGDYVYYATPSTEKNSSGAVANTDLQFAMTKLDGSETVNFFTTSNLETKYRFVEVDGVVYVVYHRSSDVSLVCYNTQTKEEIIIATTDMEADTSLSEYVFLSQDMAGDIAVLYTKKIYNQPYVESDHEGHDHSAEEAEDERGAESYNELYAYKAGEKEGKLIFDGSKGNYKYSVPLVKNGYVFYSQKDSAENAVTLERIYAIAPAKLYAKDFNSAKQIKDTTLVADTTIIETLDKAYIANSDNNIIYEVSLITGVKTIVATLSSTSSALVLKNGDYMYYYNSENKLVRINVESGKTSSVKPEVQAVSENTVATEWFKPEVIGGYIYYCDNSDYGASYIKRIKINDSKNIVEKQADDGTKTYFLSGEEDLAIMTDDDIAKVTTKLIGDVKTNGKIVFDTFDSGDKKGQLKKDEDGKFYSELFEETNELYTSLTEEQKKLLAEEDVAEFEKYQQAYKLSQAFSGLYEFYPSKTAAQKDAYEDAYKTAKAALEELEKTDFAVLDVRNLVADRFNYFYQEADEYFGE